MTDDENDSSKRKSSSHVPWCFAQMVSLWKSTEWVSGHQTLLLHLLTHLLSGADPQQVHHSGLINAYKGLFSAKLQCRDAFIGPLHTLDGSVDYCNPNCLGGKLQVSICHIRTNFERSSSCAVVKPYVFSLRFRSICQSCLTIWRSWRWKRTERRSPFPSVRPATAGTAFICTRYPQCTINYHEGN